MSSELFELRAVADESGRGYAELRARLSCGCWGEWHFDGSSQWDFPDEAFICAEHGERQFDLRVQAILNADEVAL